MKAKILWYVGLGLIGGGFSGFGIKGFMIAGGLTIIFSILVGNVNLETELEWNQKNDL